MGIFGKKPTKPPKKTYEEVFADLVSNLATKANNSLSNPIRLPAQPTLDDLQSIFQLITRNRFYDTFQYNFAAAASPPNLAPGTRVLSAFEKFYKVDDPNKNNQPPSSSTSDKGDDHSKDFVPIPDDRQPLSAILSDFRSQIQGLPSWMQDDAQNYIVNRLETVFTTSGSWNDWTSDVNTPVYDQSDKYANSIRLDCVFVRLSGELTETEVKSQLDTVYCLGIYYYTISEATIAKTQLWKDLYKQGTLLLNPPPPVPDNPTKNGLEALLIVYRDNKLFKGDFGFSFNETPPNLIDDRGRPSHLFIIADDDYSSLADEINREVLSKVNFPNWAAASVKEGIRAQVDRLLKFSTSDTAGWIARKYEDSPKPPSDQEALFFVKAEFVFCTLIAPNRSDVTFRGLYFCGVFYTGRSVEDSLSQELLNVVYNDAVHRFAPSITPPDQPTRADLNKLLSQALDDKFKATFGYDYAGPDTKPKNQFEKSTVLYSAKVWYDTESNDDAAVSSITDKIVSAFKFELGDAETKMAQRIHDDLQAKVKQCLNAPDPNVWAEMSHKRDYDYARLDDRALTGNLTILYCNANVTAHSAVQKRNFVYVVGVFYDVELVPW